MLQASTPQKFTQNHGSTYTYQKDKAGAIK